jgi:hypothetical protein
MSTKARQLGLCLLVVAALAAFAAPAAQAIDFSHTEVSLGGSKEQACNNAVQKIKDRCDSYGPITTNPGACKPIYNSDGLIVAEACTCRATTTYCVISTGPLF